MANRQIPSTGRPRQRAGDATPSFAWARKLAATERRTDNLVRRCSQEIKVESSQAAQANRGLACLSSASVSFAFATCLLIFSGCQTSKPTSVATLSQSAKLRTPSVAATSSETASEKPFVIAQPDSGEEAKVSLVSAAESLNTTSSLRQRVKQAGYSSVVTQDIDASTKDIELIDPPEPVQLTEEVDQSSQPPYESTEPSLDEAGDEDAESEATEDADSADAESEEQDAEESLYDSIGQTVPPEYDRPQTPPISLEALLESVRSCYPEIDIAIGELNSAEGKVLASWGQFDEILTAHSISQPLGFYQTYRNGVGISRPLYDGGEVYGTYRIGDGNFEPWYGERETNEGGEFKAGFSLPLIKDRFIDKRRAKLFATGYQRDQLNANVEARLLMFQRTATQVYWDWVASGQAVQIQQRLIELANQRVDQIKSRVKAGDLAQIAQIDNDRLIAKRKNSLIKARRQFEKASIKLSLFWRNAQCNPVIPSQDQVPSAFPASQIILGPQLLADIDNALIVRPELTELAAARKEACTELRYAENLTLPKLDLKGFAGQDVGGETSSTGDKTPFELQLGVLAEVPLQRREGIGKMRAATGKLNQIDAKIGFTSDKIRGEIQDAASAVNAAAEQILQSMENLRLTRRSLELGRISFEEGDIDLLLLNIYESAVADAELQLLDAQFKHFFYRTVYDTAIRGTFD